MVFDALTARDDQLAPLITNSNNVFATTAQRNAELQQIFQVLPTFQRESTTTVNRLTQFARNTNPLVTELRPAARELSPTLQQLSLLAPDLKALFRDLGPLVTASKKGLPALTNFLDEFRPFLGDFDAPLRQLNPILRYIGAYKNELRTFFANVAGGDPGDRPPGRTPRRPVHYLRTLNPVNPENLAQYPHRLGTNRNNPTSCRAACSSSPTTPRASYETRAAAAAAAPTIVPPNPTNPERAAEQHPQVHVRLRPAA